MQRLMKREDHRGGIRPVSSVAWLPTTGFIQLHVHRLGLNEGIAQSQDSAPSQKMSITVGLPAVGIAQDHLRLSECRRVVPGPLDHARQEWPIPLGIRELRRVHVEGEQAVSTAGDHHGVVMPAIEKTGGINGQSGV